MEIGQKGDSIGAAPAARRAAALAFAVIVMLALLVTVSHAADQSCTLDADCPFGEVCGGCPSGQTCGGAGDSRCQSMPTTCNICAANKFCGSVGPTACNSDADCASVQCSGGFCGAVSGGICKPCSTSAECVKKTFEKAVPYLGAVSPWFSIALMAVMIAVLAAGAVYVLGVSFNVEPIKRAGSAELAQAAASLILILMLFGAEQFEVSLLDQLERTTGAVTAAVFSPEMFQGSAATGEIRMNPFDVSYAFIRNMLTCAERQYRKVYDNSIGNELIANFRLAFTIEVPILKQGTPVEPMALIPTFARAVARAEYDADELTWLSIFLYAQIAILKFFETSMFTVFLPIGLILRAFPPTRGAGAVLSAIAIGFYMVYPLVFTILYVGTPKVIDGCSIYVPMDTQKLTKSCPLEVGAVSGQISQAQTLSAGTEVDMTKVEAGMASLKYSAYVYMIVSLGATFMFVRSASTILGADISEIGRSMFRMI
ncbi:Uncharacterised protein [uncultured archaeon]|nr:Uncharacterised protein [uncultured archaeon]